MEHIVRDRSTKPVVEKGWVVMIVCVIYALILIVIAGLFHGFYWMFSLLNTAQDEESLSSKVFTVSTPITSAFTSPACSVSNSPDVSPSTRRKMESKGDLLILTSLSSRTAPIAPSRFMR